MKSRNAVRYDVAAPAKVNVCLAITGRRADGYHDIATVMAPLELADGLIFEIEEGPSAVAVTCEGRKGAPDGAGNLAGRAISAFLAAAGLKASVRIHVRKEIPVGAGLGGGSSDAGITLRTINEHFGRPLGDDAVWRLARGLGSDVPFFLRDGWAYATGRGEFVTAVSGPEGVPLLLAAPDRGIPTPQVYRELTPGDFAGDLGATWDVIADLRKPAERWWGSGLNSLEGPACRAFPLLAELKATLRELGFANARLSGSGGTYVAPVAAEAVPAAEEAVAELTRAGHWSTVTSTRRFKK
jgi:4-diphosphocytidyl-2-C-methyl-D-erythritol kinase